MRRLLLSTTALVLLLGCERTPIDPRAADQHPAFSTSAGALTFTNTPLLQPLGASEPAITVAGNGTVAVSALGWLGDRGTKLWIGPFGSTPTFQAVIDADLQQPGKVLIPGSDADVDIGTTGTLHATTAIGLIDPALRGGTTFGPFTWGVSAITCPDAASSFDPATCHAEFIDRTTIDRPWITSDGSRVYIGYKDADYGAVVHVARSDDDGATWRRVGDPIVGQGRATGNATVNNQNGPIVADPSSHNVYDIYVAGEAGIQKATSYALNNVYVSRSSDGGAHWTAFRVFHAPLFTRLWYFFPTLAVDPVTGWLHAAWSDGNTVFYATSTDAGTTWSPAVAVNIAPASTAIFPSIAARNGVVNLVYYGTDAASATDPTAVWNVYLAKTTGGGASFEQSRVSNTPNHVGVLCTGGFSCPLGSRNLLDLFEIAIDPATGSAAVVYVDDTITQVSGAFVPQIVLAYMQ